MAINVQIHDRSVLITMSGRFDFEVHRDFKNSYMPLINLKNAVEIYVKNGCNSILARICGKKCQLLRVCHELAGSKQ